MGKILLALALVAVIPTTSFAVLCNGVENKLNLCYPAFPGAPAIQGGQGLANIIAWLYALIVGISGLAAFVMIVWGGVKWMSSQGDPTAIGDAKDKIKMAFLGLLLVLASFLVLQIINPELTLLKNPLE